MKIGYLMDAGVPDVREAKPSGPAIHVLRTIQELKRLGHEVRLVARLSNRVLVSNDLLEYSPVRTPLMDGIRLAESVIRRTQRELGLPYVAWFDGMRFAEACTRELSGFDIFYERMGWMGRGGSIAARRAQVPHVLEINGDHLREHEQQGMNATGMQMRLSLDIMRTVAQRATHAVATGEGWRRRHLQNWQVEPSKVSVIHNGSDVVELLSRDQLRSYQMQDGSPKEPFRLIYVGSFDPWQNLPSMLRGMRAALDAGLNVQLTIAGSGAALASLQQLASELALTDTVTFAGHLPMAELSRQLAGADAGISLYDGRVEFDGLKLFDYKSAGLAVIATGKNGEPASIRAGITGTIIPPADANAFVAALRELHDNRGLAAKMGRQSRADAEQMHGWKHTAQSLERLFLTLVGRSGHAPSVAVA
ncbi:MAG: glycosyltransferase family 4 protein [Acidobacteriota bacterium]